MAAPAATPGRLWLFVGSCSESTDAIIQILYCQNQICFYINMAQFWRSLYSIHFKISIFKTVFYWSTAQIWMSQLATDEVDLKKSGITLSLVTWINQIKWQNVPWTCLNSGTGHTDWVNKSNWRHISTVQSVCWVGLNTWTRTPQRQKQRLTIRIQKCPEWGSLIDRLVFIHYLPLSLCLFTRLKNFLLILI